MNCRAGTDAIIVNTCCVTRTAERKSRQRFRWASRKFPGRPVIVTGCACQLDPVAYAGAAEIIGIDQRNREIKGVFPAARRSRYFLKIQDGCNEPCTYCIVPRVRTSVISKPWSEIRAEIDWATRQGFPEIVLVGANIGLYGHEQAGNLNGLLQLLAGTSSLPRLRLTSLEPRFVNRELIRGLARIPVCDHFHLALQSADDRILNAMGRTYRRVDLETILAALRDNFPDALLGADIIVGFPGEDEEAFSVTRDFIAHQPNLVHLHVFPYSLRPGTRAEVLGDPVPRGVKRQRLSCLNALIKTKHDQFQRRFIGQTLSVVVIRPEAGLTCTLTSNYLTVYVPDPPAGARHFRVRVERIESGRLIGRTVKE